MKPQVLFLGDDATLSVRAEKSNQSLRVNCKAFEDARIILPGEVLEVSYGTETGQVLVTRKKYERLNMHDPAHVAIADAIKGMTRTYYQAHPGRRTSEI